MSNPGFDDGRPLAVVQAETGAEAWRDVVRRQRSAIPQHADFYAIAGELVATLYAAEDLVRLLAEQVEAYGDVSRLYDDTYEVDPVERLAEAVEALADSQPGLASAARAVNEFWSAIGHIGVADAGADEARP